jgi:hypothetical protein
MGCLAVCLNGAGQGVEVATSRPLATNSSSLLVPPRYVTQPHRSIIRSASLCSQFGNVILYSISTGNFFCLLKLSIH